jgi:protein SCO1/2
MKPTAALVALAMLLAAPRPAGAQETVPQELQDIAIVDRPGSQVPLDVELTNHLGRQVTLGEYFADGRPVVFVLAYYRCPMLCSLVVNGLNDGLKELAWTPGEQFRVLVVSFDPRDTVAVARDKRDNYLRDYGRAIGEGGYEFLVGSEEQVRRLSDALGFRYRWDEATGQYAHAAAAFVTTPQGRLSRTLYGIQFPARQLRLALVEAAEGKLGNAWDQVVLFCFHYDPDARGYVLAATRLMRAGGFATVLLLSIVLFRFWRGESGRARRGGGLTHE